MLRMLIQVAAGSGDRRIYNLWPELLEEMQEFIYANFTGHPELQVRVGPILPREAALDQALHDESIRRRAAEVGQSIRLIEACAAGFPG